MQSIRTNLDICAMGLRIQAYSTKVNAIPSLHLIRKYVMFHCTAHLAYGIGIKVVFLFRGESIFLKGNMSCEAFMVPVLTLWGNKKIKIAKSYNFSYNVTYGNTMVTPYRVKQWLTKWITNIWKQTKIKQNQIVLSDINKDWFNKILRSIHTSGFGAVFTDKMFVIWFGQIFTRIGLMLLVLPEYCRKQWPCLRISLRHLSPATLWILMIHWLLVFKRDDLTAPDILVMINGRKLNYIYIFWYIPDTAVVTICRYMLFALRAKNFNWKPPRQIWAIW